MPRTTRKRFWATRIRGLVARWTTKVSHNYVILNICNVIFNPFKAADFHTDLYFKECFSIYINTSWATTLIKVFPQKKSDFLGNSYCKYPLILGLKTQQNAPECSLFLQEIVGGGPPKPPMRGGTPVILSPVSPLATHFTFNRLELHRAVIFFLGEPRSLRSGNCVWFYDCPLGNHI